MPANRAHISTPEVARLWPHLEHLANSIPPLQDCKVGLLVGHNCIKALTPRDVITPTGDGPYGQQTDLGWGIMGLVNGTWDDDDIRTSHHIVVRDVANDLFMPGGSGHIIFSLKNKIKEVIDPNGIIKMFELDFNENYGDSKRTKNLSASWKKVFISGIVFTKCLCHSETICLVCQTTNH